MNAINERLKTLRNALKLNQSDFAAKIGLSKSTIALMEISDRNVLDRHIVTICSIFNVNEKWLRTGEGEIFSEPDILKKLSAKYHLSDIEKGILYNYLTMNEDDRKMFMKQLFLMINNTQKDANTEEIPQIIAASSGDIGNTQE